MHMVKLNVATIGLIFLINACSTGGIDGPGENAINTDGDGDSDGDGDGDGDVDPDADSDGRQDECLECEDTQLCRGGHCVESDALCDTIECAEGTTCYLGICRPEDPCDDVECANQTEACQDGRCVVGDEDNDSDGVSAREDCDDRDPSIHPGAGEQCNGKDDDCDLLIDEDSDEDGDGFPGCEDTSVGLHDCDGAIDESFDDDGDGYLPEGCGSGPVDCNDNDNSVYPDATEICDGVDNDCDGVIDMIDGVSVCPMCPFGDGTTVATGLTEIPSSCSPDRPCYDCIYVPSEDDFFWCRSLDGGPYSFIPAHYCTPGRQCQEARCDDTVVFCSSDTWLRPHELPADSCDGIDNDCDGSIDNNGSETTCPICPYGDGTVVSEGVQQVPSSCSASRPCGDCIYSADEGTFFWCRSLDGGPFDYIEALFCRDSNEDQVAECADVCVVCQDGSWMRDC